MQSLSRRAIPLVLATALAALLLPAAASAQPAGSAGDAEVEVTASAQDPNYGGTVAVSRTQVVRLRRA
jgi:hypothetical protein